MKNDEPAYVDDLARLSTEQRSAIRVRTHAAFEDKLASGEIHEMEARFGRTLPAALSAEAVVRAHAMIDDEFDLAEAAVQVRLAAVRERLADDPALH